MTIMAAQGFYQITRNILTADNVLMNKGAAEYGQMAKFRVVQPKCAVTVWLFKTCQSKEAVSQVPEETVVFWSRGSVSPVLLKSCITSHMCVHGQTGETPRRVTSLTNQWFHFKTKCHQGSNCCNMSVSSELKKQPEQNLMHGPNVFCPAATSRPKGKVQRKSLSWLQNLLFFFLLRTFHVVIFCFLWESLLRILHKYASQTLCQFATCHKILWSALTFPPCSFGFLTCSISQLLLL